MILARYAVAFALTSLLAGCGGDASGPGAGSRGGGAPTATVTDPSGDTFGAGAVPWDVTGMTLTRDAAGVTVRLDFSTNLISPTSGDADAMVGFVDFDTDRDPATGVVPAVDEFRPPNSGSTGMGTDYRLALTTYAPDSTVSVKDAQGRLTGQVKPVFNGKQVTIRIPRGLLGQDDGDLNAAAIAGTVGRPSDIIPDNGHLRLGGPGYAATSLASSPELDESISPIE